MSIAYAVLLFVGCLLSLHVGYRLGVSSGVEWCTRELEKGLVSPSEESAQSDAEAPATQPPLSTTDTGKGAA